MTRPHTHPTRSQITYLPRPLLIPCRVPIRIDASYTHAMTHPFTRPKSSMPLVLEDQITEFWIFQVARGLSAQSVMSVLQTRRQIFRALHQYVQAKMPPDEDRIGDLTFFILSPLQVCGDLICSLIDDLWSLVVTSKGGVRGRAGQQA